MKTFLKRIAVLIIALATVYSFASCGEKEVSVDEAYAMLSEAVNDTINNITELSVSLNATAEVKQKNDSDESADSTEFTVGTYTATANASVVTDKDKMINGVSLYIDLKAPDDGELKLEMYAKDGYSYSYTNLFGESYSYDVFKSEQFDLSGIKTEDVSEVLNKFKENVPSPTAVEKDGELTLTWNITEENKGEYLKAYYALTGETAEDSEINNTVEEITVNKGIISLTIKDKRLKKLEVEVDLEKDEETAKGSLVANFEFSGITINYDAARLKEIKDNAEGENESQSGQSQSDD